MSAKVQKTGQKTKTGIKKAVHRSGSLRFGETAPKSRQPRAGNMIVLLMDEGLFQLLTGEGISAITAEDEDLGLNLCMFCS